MNFITKFPRTAKGFDAIWVIIDRLAKMVHILAIQRTSLADKSAKINV